MKKVDIIRIRYIFHCVFKRNGYEHTAFLKRHNVFYSMGDNCFFQPWNVSADSKYVRLGNNVVVASGVEFICHDVVDNMLNHSVSRSEITKPLGEGYRRYWGTIDIGSNVFIGARAMLLPNVQVGNNVIIAAGALVNSDIPDNVIVGGVPAKIIGKLDDFIIKRKQYSETELAQLGRSERIAYLWNIKESGKDE